MQRYWIKSSVAKKKKKINTGGKKQLWEKLQSWKLWNRKVKQSPDKERPNFIVIKLRTKRAGQSKCSAVCYIWNVLYKCHTEHEHLNLKTTKSLWSTFWFLFSGMLCLLVWGCIFCCHSALGNMQGAENWFTGRDLDFSITQHTCCQVGRAGNNPRWLTYPQKHTAVFLPLCSKKKLLLAADCNDLCCPSLEPDDRGHVHFHHAAYCISVMSISRWVADLLS